MRTTGLTILFFLLSAGRSFLADNSVNSSFPAIDKKIVFNLPVINASNTQKNQSPIDTAELKKGSWYSQIIKKIKESEYEIKYDELTHSYVSPNRKQNLRAFYSSDQFTLLPRNNSADKWDLTLQLKGIYADADKLYAAANDPVIIQNENSIQFNHNNQFITEYINSKEGVRQNFIISQQPAGNPQILKVELEVNKGWFINRVHDQELHFAKVEGDQLFKKITYNSLRVWDAKEKELEAKFTVNKTHTAFSIDVDAVNAVYPITIDPLSTTVNWTAESNQADAWFGQSVSSAGDVNGDGYSDVIIGAPYYDNGEIDEGRAYVYYGSSTGISMSPSWTTESDQANALYGFSVASAGDVNGDGYSDAIVGAATYSNGQSFEGMVYVYYGSSAGLVIFPSWTAESDQAIAIFGQSVGSAGDVNGDGYSDVIIGADEYDNGETDEGRAYVYYGSSAGLLLSPAWIVESDNPGAHFGVSVASSGDVNGDGYSDVIVGAPIYENGQAEEGKAYVYYGSNTGLSTTPEWTVESDQAGARLGRSAGSAGDVNGDGYSDVVVGAYLYDNGQTNEGRAWVYFGSATGLSITPGWVTESDQANAAWGYSVASAGDVNGDGYSDVIVGSPSYFNGELGEGRAYVYYGSSTGLSIVAAWTAESDQTGANLGECVGSAGDINGDGYSDVIVGAWYYDNGQTDEGAAFVYHGSPDGLKTISNWQVLEAQGGANYGLSVASAGDVNSDGFSDVLVGAYIYNDGFNDNGKAYLYMGSATGLSTTAAWTATGSMTNEYFGRCVASAGDVNGDGYGDVLIGAYGYSNGQSQEGRVYLYYGSAGGLAGAAAWSYENNVATSVLGVSVAAAGDVNADGYSDIIIGGPQYANGEANEGIVYLFYGSPAIPASTADWSVEGNQAGAFFGISVAGLGDVNGDGFSDVIIGAYLYDSGNTDEGGAFAYYGSATGLPVTPNWTAESNQLNAGFGICVAAAGDVNGDGYGDAIAGALNYDNGTTDEGAAFVYYGSSSGLSPTASWIAENNIANSFFGYSVCSAGDVNGDGYSDILIGAREISNGEAREGALYAYYGSSTGLPVSSSWYVESNIANIILGNSVASAGDVNGDGFSDVIGGAPYYASLNGAAFVYYGNNNTGLRHNLRLYNSDLVTPIRQSSIGPALFGAGLYARSPLGRQKGKLVWETVMNGQAFPGIPITNSTTFLSQQPLLTDLGLAGIELKYTIAKVFTARATYLRARVKYDPVTAITGQVYGPWRYPESFLRGNRDLGAVALPVKFISFVALKQNDNTVLLKWITTDETPGIAYEVQHSIDGIQFETIKNITGFNNSRNEYECVHNNPSTGKNFYRIRAVENGKDAFSVMRQVYFGNTIQAIIYPNPVKSGSQLKIELINGTVSGFSFIELFSTNGQKKISHSITGSGNIITITVPDLPTGQYFVKLINDNRVIYAGNFIVVE